MQVFIASAPNKAETTIGLNNKQLTRTLEQQQKAQEELNRLKNPLI
jgi:hypothetical protein